MGHQHTYGDDFCLVAMSHFLLRPIANRADEHEAPFVIEPPAKSIERHEANTVSATARRQSFETRLVCEGYCESRAYSDREPRSAEKNTKFRKNCALPTARECLQRWSKQDKSRYMHRLNFREWTPGNSLKRRPISNSSFNLLNSRKRPLAPPTPTPNLS